MNNTALRTIGAVSTTVASLGAAVLMLDWRVSLVMLVVGLCGMIASSVVLTMRRA